MAALVAEKLSGERLDAVFVDHWLMAQYLPAGFSGRKLLHEHNAEFLIWQREAAAARNPLVGWLLRREHRRVRAYESQILGQFDTVFAVSEPDRQALIALGTPADGARVLPNLPDPALLDAPGLAFERTAPVALFLGTLSWKPNIDSATRMLRDIFPQVHARLPETRLVVAGRDAPSALRALAARTSGAEFIGDAVDAGALYTRARVFVEATRSGGGTKLKVLNALARGLPVAVSPEGAEGLEVVPGESALVADSDTAFAEAVVRLLTDEVLWQRLSERGRAVIRERYVADAAFGALEESLSGVPARG
jgi:glycosyltransferase involved in cell wall biosynthesis